MEAKVRCVICRQSDFSLVHPDYHGRRIGRCRACDLVQVIPMPSAKEVAQLYHEDLAHFDPYVSQLDAHRSYFRDFVLRLRKIMKPRRLLDIGCAMGILLEEAKKIGIHAYGVDVSKDAVRVCRKKGLHVDTRPPHGKTFDVVTAFEVIEHEPNPLGMLRKIKTLLRPGGYVFLTTPNHNTLWRLVMGRSWVGYGHPEHVTFFESKTLKALLTEAGFRKVKVSSDKPRPYRLSYLFIRGADYMPSLGWLLRPVGGLLDKFKLVNPINPWGDLIVVGQT